jgi:hypothetical protein
MNNFFLIALAHAVVTMVAALLCLARAHLKLKGELRVLTDLVQKSNKDIAGIQFTTLSTERRLATADDQLRALVAKVSTFQQNEQSVPPSNTIIQKIRNGASVDELMHDCSMCRDEAALLIRLYGSGGA